MSLVLRELRCSGCDQLLELTVPWKGVEPVVDHFGQFEACFVVDIEVQAGNLAVVGYASGEEIGRAHV